MGRANHSGRLVPKRLPFDGVVVVVVVVVVTFLDSSLWWEEEWNVIVWRISQRGVLVVVISNRDHYLEKSLVRVLQTRS